MAQPRDKFFIHPSSTPLKHFIQPRGQGRYTDAVFAEVTANGTSMTCSSSMRWYFQSKTELVTLRQQVLAGRLVTILGSIAAFWCVRHQIVTKLSSFATAAFFESRFVCVSTEDTTNR